MITRLLINWGNIQYTKTDHIYDHTSLKSDRKNYFVHNTGVYKLNHRHRGEFLEQFMIDTFF